MSKRIAIILAAIVGAVVIAQLLRTHGFARWSGEADLAIVVLVKNAQDPVPGARVDLVRTDNDVTTVECTAVTDERGLALLSVTCQAGGESAENWGVTHISPRDLSIRVTVENAPSMEEDLFRHTPKSFDEDDHPYVVKLAFDLESSKNIRKP